MPMYSKEGFIKKALERTSREWLNLAKESAETENFIYYLTLARLRDAINAGDIDKQRKLTQELRCLSYMLQD